MRSLSKEIKGKLAGFEPVAMIILVP